MSLQPALSCLFLMVLDIMHLMRVFFVDFLICLVSKCTKGGSSKVLSTYFSGKTVLITGASSGLGKAIALELAEVSSAGALPINMILSSRSIDQLEAVAEKCREMSPMSIVAVVSIDMADLSVETNGNLTTYMTSLHSILKKNSLSGIDCLVGNAGVSSRGTALNTSGEVLSDVMNVNFFGPVALTKAIAKDMCIRKAGGSIAVVSSVQGKLGLPLRTSYAASKHALQGYFDSLRGELSSHGITVTVLSPGYISTNLSINAVTSTGEKYGVTDETTKSGMTPAMAAHLSLMAIATETPDFVMADAKTVAAIQGKAQFPDLMARFMNARAKKSMIDVAQ